MSYEPNPIRIVVADEQPNFLRGLRRLLKDERDFQILGEASDAQSAVKVTCHLKPDILLLDLALLRRLELQALSSLASDLFPVRIVVMATAIEKAHIVEAFRIGAHGIVLKTSELPVLLKSIRSVAAGHYWLESERVGLLVEVLRDFLPRCQGNTATTPNDYGLTARELSIIAKITSGCSNKEVGQEFSISERTVKHHLTNIFNKVGVSSRLQLALFAANHHLMSGEAQSLVPTVSTTRPRILNGKAFFLHQFSD